MKKLKYGYQKVNKEDIIERLLEDDKLRRFFIDNDLDARFIEGHLQKLFNHKIESERCKNCTSLNECSQDMVGHEPGIRFVDKQLQTYYKECVYYRTRQEKTQQEKLIDALYMPKMIYNASLEDFDFSRGKNRTHIHNRLTSFVTMYLNGEKLKGLYLYGAYQRGKTYCLAALANELSKHGIKVMVAYYPDLVRELKSRISNNTLEEMISRLKQIEILMLDDIGGENQSSWVRDEILGPILQHRLLDEKPTFFTSNLKQKDLMNIMVTSSSRTEQIKAARIDARIKSLSDEIEM